MCKSLFVIIAAAPAALAPPPAATDSQLTTASLVERCESALRDPQGADASYCHAFVAGFLAGASSIDPRIRPDRTGGSGKESLADRATRTRLARSVTGNCAARTAAFCVSGDVPVPDVARRIVEFAQSRPAYRGIEAREAVFAALQADYACRRPTARNVGE